MIGHKTILPLACLLLLVSSTIAHQDVTSDVIDFEIDGISEFQREGRSLLDSCTILGKSFTACYFVVGGQVGYSLSGNKLSVGFKGGNPSGWAAWAVGQPHKGASAVFNSQGAISTRTMRGQSISQITPPSKVKFSSVKGGQDGGALAATFSLKWPGSGSIKVSFATGNGNLEQHAGIPNKYTLSKTLVQS